MGLIGRILQKLLNAVRRDGVDMRSTSSEHYTASPPNYSEYMPPIDATSSSQEVIRDVVNLNEGGPPIYIDPNSISYAFLALTHKEAKRLNTITEDVIAHLNHLCQPRLWSAQFITQFVKFTANKSKGGYPDIGSIPVLLSKLGLSSQSSIVINISVISLDGGKSKSKVYVGFAYLDKTPRIILPYNDACIPDLDSPRNTNIGGSLRFIDEKYRELSSTDIGLARAQHAIDSHDGAFLYSVLSQCYGQLSEVICLRGPLDAQCILVFDAGVGLLAGVNSFISVLTFGYDGTGPTIMSAFLTASGFANPDASSFKPPVIVYRDGNKVYGIAEGGELLWQDGTKTVIPKFPGDE